MKINKLYFCLVLSLLALMIAGSFSPAYAADSDKWTGFYAGVNMGYGMGKATTMFMPMQNQRPDPAGFIALLPQQLHPESNGVLGGGQFGFNAQWKRLVLGAETDFQGTGMDGSTIVSPIIQNNGTSFGGGTLSASQHMKYFGTFRPRVGVAVFPKLLVYATGGVAYGGVDLRAETNFRPVGTTDYIAKKEVQKGGWCAGAGMEFKLRSKWSVKGEYLHYNMGSEHIVVDSTPPFMNFQVGYGFSVKAHIIRGGLNYRF